MDRRCAGVPLGHVNMNHGQGQAAPPVRCMPAAGFLLAGLLAAYCACGPSTAQTNATVSINILVYGRSLYPASRATTSLPADRRIPFVWTVFLIRANDRNILIDAGFTDPKLRQPFALFKYSAPADLLLRAGVWPEQITDVVLTHAHFDHADGLAALPRARVHLHADALEVLARRWGRRRLRALQGRLKVFRAPSRVGPLTVVPVGGHARGASVARLETAGQTWVFVGDECYLVSDCLAGRPLPDSVTVNAAANRTFVQSLAKEARASRLVVLPNHDPSILRGCPPEADVCRLHSDGPLNRPRDTDTSGEKEAEAPCSAPYLALREAIDFCTNCSSTLRSTSESDFRYRHDLPVLCLPSRESRSV